MAPAVLHEIHRQPVEQLAVRRLGRARAEVLRRLDNADAEHRLPQPVHRHARGERRAFIREPLRERETRGRRILGQRMQRRGHVRQHGFPALVPRAAVQAVRLARIFATPFGEMQNGGHRFGIILPELPDRVVEALQFRHRGSPGIEDGLGLLRRAFIRRNKHRQHRRISRVVHLRIRRLCERDAEMADLRVLRAVVIATVIGEQSNLELGARRQSQRWCKLRHGDGLRVPPSGAAIRAPRRVLVAVGQKCRRPAQTAIVLVARLIFPFRLHACHGLLGIAARVDELQLFPFLAARSFRFHGEFRERPGSLETAAGATEWEIVVFEDLQPDARHRLHFRPGKKMHVAGDRAMPQREDAPVGQHRGMIQFRGRMRVLRLDHRPLGLVPLRQLRRGPRRQFFLPVGMRLLQARLRRREVRVQLRDRLLLLVGIDPRLRFIGVIQKSEEAVILRVRHGIELVRVALRTPQREAQHPRAHGIHPVEHAFHAPLLGHDRAFFVGHAVPEKTGRDDLLLRAIRQQIARDLFGDEPVVRHVRIERMDHPVAPRPLLARQILFKPVRVRVARHIQPLPRPLFAKAFVLHQSIRQCRGCGLESLRRGLFHK